MACIDMVGDHYGEWTVLRRAPNRSESDKSARWFCRCSCGNERVVYRQDLRAGKSTNCGCTARASRIAAVKKAATVHGLSKTAIYRKWSNMIQRCEKPYSVSYRNYGARGIKVCERWHKFENFLSDMGYPPPGMSLDRIDNDGNYSPENCHWATPREQACNRKNSKNLTHQGITMTVNEWARALGISPITLYDRIARGFPTEKLFSRNLKLTSQNH